MLFSSLDTDGDKDADDEDADDCDKDEAWVRISCSCVEDDDLIMRIHKAVLAASTINVRFAI